MSAKEEGQFEDKMKRLEEIVQALESPDLSLENGLELYKEGARCARYCREKLEHARHELEVWSEEQALPLDLGQSDSQEEE